MELAACRYAASKAWGFGSGKAQGTGIVQCSFSPILPQNAELVSCRKMPLLGRKTLCRWKQRVFSLPKSQRSEGGWHGLSQRFISRYHHQNLVMRKAAANGCRQSIAWLCRVPLFQKESWKLTGKKHQRFSVRQRRVRRLQTMFVVCQD